MYWKLTAATVVHAVLGAAPSILVSILNPVELIIKDFANQTYGCNQTEEAISVLWGLVNSCFTAGCCIGPIIIAYSSEKFGRRATIMLLNSGLVIFSALLGFASKLVGRFELLLLNRLISGVADALFLFTYVYIVECCSADDAKVLGALFRMGDVTWYVIGAALGLPSCLGTIDLWHWMLLIPAFTALLYAACTPFIPESPKHLLITLDDENSSKEAIRFYYGPDVDTEAVIGEYRLETLHVNQSSVGICEVMTVRHLRWPFFICAIAAVSSRTSGFDIDNSYSTQLITDMGVAVEEAALYNLLLLRLPIIALAALFIPIAKYFNNRKALLCSLLTGSIAVSMMCVSEAIHQWIPGSPVSMPLLIVSIALQMCAFQLGGAVYPNILPGEICIQVIRSLTSAYSSAAGGLTSVIITFSFSPVASMIGETLALLPLVVVSWIVFIWLFKYLPDTNNKTVNEIVAQWLDQDEEHELEQLLQ